MVEEFIKAEIHDMSEKIYELQQKTEHLTNGQRYAAINEINKSIQPLKNDLRHLEHELYTQQTNDETIRENIKTIEKQINELESIKSDLETRINTETEHTRQELNNKIISFMSDELTPIKTAINDNKTEISSIKQDINQLRMDMIERDKNRDIKEAARFDKIKMIIVGVVGLLTAVSVLFTFLEPTIRTLLSVFF